MIGFMHKQLLKMFLSTLLLTEPYLFAQGSAALDLAKQKADAEVAAKL